MPVCRPVRSQTPRAYQQLLVCFLTNIKLAQRLFAHQLSPLLPNGCPYALLRNPNSHSPRCAPTNGSRADVQHSPFRVRAPRRRGRVPTFRSVLCHVLSSRLCSFFPDHQHIMFMEVMGKYPAPLPEVLAEDPSGEPKAAVDLGCGSGSW